MKKGDSIEVTGLGLKTIEVLDKYCPDILDEKLTRDFEKDMDKIRKGKSNEKETEYLKPAKEEKINIDETIIRTEFDKLHELIEKKEKIKLNDIISEFKISKKLAEEWVLILEEEGLVKIHYSPFGDIEIRKWKKR